ncbi:MAG: BLUF domain-containing protein [Verrucomicrobiales bacterium]|nr:BLUF domain-containing protein [Verrucomicrobiales bacterium]
MESESDSLICLLYVSTLTSELTEETLESILSKSRIRNEELGVTGLLLVFGEHIVQVLEGPPTEVRRVYASIEIDSRHRNVSKMVDVPVDRRFFPDWSMAFQKHPDSAPDPNPALQKLLQSEEKGTVEMVKKLFEIFGIFLGIGKKHDFQFQHRNSR